jgi:hypothetical protein
MDFIARTVSGDKSSLCTQGRNKCWTPWLNGSAGGQRTGRLRARPSLCLGTPRSTRGNTENRGSAFGPSRTCFGRGAVSSRIGEFRSTQYCCACPAKLEDPPAVELHKRWKVRRCMNNGCERVFSQRDVNAAINLAKFFMWESMARRNQQSSKHAIQH